MNVNFTPGAAPDLFVLTTGVFEPGKAQAFCSLQETEALRDFGRAELLYFQGETDRAAGLFETLRDSDEPVVAPAAGFAKLLCELAGGDAKDFLAAYHRLLDLRAILPETGEMPQLVNFAILYFNILLGNTPAIRFPTFGVNAFSVPQKLLPMAFYAYTHYLIESGDVGRAVGMAEGALIFAAKPCPVAEIYLCLMISIGYMARQLWDRAEYYFRRAWEIAKPDGLIMPFAEHRGLLFGLLEKCLRYEEPEAYKRILELANKYHSRWVCIHNALTGERISDALTAIEYNVAVLASRGLANKEIADFLGVSVNSVRAHLRNIFNKLDIESRKELSGYVT